MTDPSGQPECPHSCSPSPQTLSLPSRRPPLGGRRRASPPGAEGASSPPQRARLPRTGRRAGRVKNPLFPFRSGDRRERGKKSPRGSRSRSLRAAPTQQRQPPTPKGGGPAVGQRRSASLRAPQRREGGAPRAALLGAHIKKKQNINFVQESSVNEEEQLDPESFQVTVGDTVMVFPPPPPPYFADCPLQTITPSVVTSDLPLSENPPPYHSTFIN
ncbi:transmembrane protein 171 [Podarcis raffonei]|uniref:transmembrane protein 171 n=1 Tax=Podarcis raffonei TaxID=65483 RepID=UPI0023292EE6|nr:transmembrane protein 171 [Podarcis raffonei]